MFNKPFRVKSNTPIKGSERKKLKAELQKCYPTITEEDLALAIPNKEEMSVMKIETHGGEIVSAHVVGKKPIVFHIRDKLYPTIYLLWILPGKLIPYFTTWHEVVPKFNNGADLMLPGFIIKEELGLRAYGRLNKGVTVAINSNTNSAAVAVGITALSSEDMYMAGRRGKGIEILHCIGDFLWQAGTKDSPPELGPPGCQPDADSKEIPPQNATTSSEEQPAESPEKKEPEELDTNHESLSEAKVSAETAVEQKNPQETMDDLLNYCFFKALRTTAKKIELPVLTSNFYRLHIVPSCPSEKTLDVKKSSYKKLSKFLDVLTKEGVIEVKEFTKGVESISAIRYDHERVRSFRVDINDKQDQLPVLEKVGEMEKYLPPVITRMYAVNAICLPLFTPTYRKGTNLTTQQIRQYLTEYVRANQLQNVTNPSQVTLDPILSDVMLKKGEIIPSLSWEELMNRIQMKLSTVYEMIFPNQTTPLIVKGELEPVEITTASRAGNKKVTLISGLETYRIDLDEFARRCQVGVAASTTITSSPAKKGQVVLVQGNQISFVGNLLIDEYGIPKQFIQGFDLKKAKSKK
ncbi:eukaryotic translation initiation factor 2D-like isoform X2 [Daphnia carinata]|uniref:eukaryotic translation initiation factor 2D-like isoform X2 n=1 Tax=Daphnia carinata TaxID=120202 RepID=UPI002868D185|nr:eukaryotic translation initiation factor 2D-like isoform X2 [Daphnia carinata]